jgi:hypothetical protein
VKYQNQLEGDDYYNMMFDKMDDAIENHLDALRRIEVEELKVAKAYNRKVREKLFQIDELVWKMILPIGWRDNKFGKWSPSWEGPYQVTRIVPGNAYFLKTLEGKSLSKALNVKYLKKYYLSVWQGS